MLSAKLHVGPFTVERLPAGAKPGPLPPPGAGYLICRADPADSGREKELLDRGFSFLDRVLVLEIDLRRAAAAPAAQGLPELRVERDGTFSEDMAAMACQAYTADRRFHLESVFDQDQAGPVIRAYLDDCARRGMTVYRALHGDELLGFTVVDEDTGDRRCFENVLGVTKPGIRGKMAAPGLYAAMLEGQRDRFQKYLGRVSSSNVSSLNLHFRLGAKVSSVYDEFIFRAV